jgi:hypothetical protein
MKCQYSDEIANVWHLGCLYPTSSVHNWRLTIMAKYLFVYHGGGMPESEAARAEMMNAWGQWFGGMGAAVVDGGNPTLGSSTVLSDGSVASNGGANPASGYSLIEAPSLDDALAKAKACPVLKSGGSVEVAEALDM